jgi:AraC-like DNA-binding protein
MKLLPRRRRLAIPCVLLVAVGFLMVAFAPDRRENLLDRVVAHSLMSDQMQGGGSMVAEESASRGFRFRYGLVRVDNNHPWAGLALQLAEPEGGAIDLLQGRRLEVRATSSRGLPVRIQILSDDAPSKGVPRDSLRPIYHALEYVPDGSRASFAWAAFTVPSWWRVRFSRSDDQRLDLLDRVRAIEIQSGDSPSGRDSSVVELLELDRVGPDRGIVVAGWLLVVLGGFGLAWLIRSGRLREVATSRPSEPLVPGQVSLDDPRARQASQLVRKLGERFADAELSLESFAATEGLSPRLVAALIKESTGLHFKGALNELRLGEAARLLKQSKGNISEIGFAVGFQSASHFGRAFREKFGVSPSEYRSKTVPASPDATEDPSPKRVE